MEATIHTNMGDIRLELFPEQAPNTVKNFTSLAKGEREWTDPSTGQQTSRPLYDGTIFHRVIDGFMIQGGDPLHQRLPLLHHRRPDPVAAGQPHHLR